MLTYKCESCEIDYRVYEHLAVLVVEVFFNWATEIETARVNADHFSSCALFNCLRGMRVVVMVVLRFITIRIELLN